MAQFKVTGPDGGTYLVTAPEHATDADIVRYMKMQTEAPRPASEDSASMPSIGPLNNAEGFQANSDKLASAYKAGGMADLVAKVLGYSGGLQEIATRGMWGGLSDYPVAGVKYAADKVADLVRGEGGRTATFNDALKETRGGVREFQRQNPITGYGAEITGGLASPLYRAIGQATAAPIIRGRALTDVGLGTRIGTYAAQGGTTGALGGAGYAQGSDGGVPSLSDLGFSTGISSAIGAAVGPVAGLAIEGAGNLFNWLRERVASRQAAPGVNAGPTPQYGGTAPGVQGGAPQAPTNYGGIPTPQPGASGAAPQPQNLTGGSLLSSNEPVNALDVAARIAARGADSDRLGTASEITQRLADMGDNAVLGDLGPNMTAYMGDAAQRPGPAMQTVTTNLQERAAGREQRLVDRFQQAVSERYNGLLDRLRGARTQNASPLYEQAFSRYGDIGGPEFDALATRPDVRRGLATGIKILQDEAAADVANGVPGARIPSYQDFGIVDFNSAGDPIIGRTMPLRAWDAAKKGMDALLYMDDSMRDQFGRLNTQGRALERMNNGLKNALDRRTTDPNTGESLYAMARREWAGPSAQIKAAGDGRSWLTDPMEDIQRTVRGYGDSEAEAAAAGVIRDIEERLQKNPNAAVRQLMTTNARNRLLNFFPESDVNSLLSHVRTEARMAANERAALGGSQTKLRQAVGQDIEGEISDAGSAAMAIAHGRGPLGIASNLAERALRSINRPTDQVMNELATMLSSRDPAIKQRAIESISRARLQLAEQERILRALASRNAVAPIGAISPVRQ